MLRSLADQAFSRVAGAPLTEGNSVRLLRDATENYPAWLAAIAAARRHVHFENYIIREDSSGEAFAQALIAKARQGVRVRVIYDWLGCLGASSRRFWSRLRAGGVEVRCHNPPRLESPLGWLTRDHRKMVAVDGEIAFVTGLCVGRMWAGDPHSGVEPWRDTGVEIRGPAVADVERAFAHVWATLGPPIAGPEPAGEAVAPELGDGVGVRIVATLPATAAMLRVDQLVAALARERVWLTDAYYAGTSLYVQTLSAAAREGVDVRLLVPGATDIPVLKLLSRAGFRPLLEAGVRIFEWKGAMLHAKTAVADGRWARVGSTNLNLASWFGNYELDAVIEDEAFARQMEEMYSRDLENATEVVLEGRRRVRARAERRPRPPGLGRGGGTSGRAAAGAIRIGNTIGAAFTNQRVLEPAETRILAGAGLAFLVVALVFGWFPRVLAYPLVAVFAWVAVALLYRAYTLHRSGKGGDGPPRN
jgi:cardiolipin synthase